MKDVFKVGKEEEQYSEAEREQARAIHNEMMEFVQEDIKPRYIDFNMVRALSKLMKKGGQIPGFKTPFPKKGFKTSDALSNELNEVEWDWLKKECYNNNIVAFIGTGTLDFTLHTMYRMTLDYIEDHLDNLKRVPSMMDYDNFLAIGRKSIGRSRQDFARIYYDVGSYVYCKGKIQRINSKKNSICFEKVYIYNPSYMELNGNIYEGKENHVWVNSTAFSGFEVGDTVEFNARIYVYIKTGNGKQLDFGLKRVENVNKIDGYFLPSDDDRLRQNIQNAICEICLFVDHCNGGCIANPEWLHSMRESMGYPFKDSFEDELQKRNASKVKGDNPGV